MVTPLGLEIVGLETVGLETVVHRTAAACLLLGLPGCGGGMPWMHGAHALDPGQVELGAGFSTTFSMTNEADPADPIELSSEQAAVSPGMAPWVGGRVGLQGGYEAALSYTGRAVWLGARKSFEFGQRALSVGIGALGLLPKRREDLGLRVGGFGGDLPVVFGWRSSSDAFSLWLGGRGGAELLRGQRTIETQSDPLLASQPLVEDLDGWHAQVGGMFGIKVGFEFVYAVLELDAAMHWAEVDIGGASASIRQFAIAPAGAIVGRF